LPILEFRNKTKIKCDFLRVKVSAPKSSFQKMYTGKILDLYDDRDLIQ